MKRMLSRVDKFLSPLRMTINVRDGTNAVFNNN